MPVTIASNIGGFLARNIMARTGLSRRPKKNIKLAFPDKSDTEIDQILIGMWDNLGRVMAEFPHLENIVKNRTKIEGLESFTKEDQACIFVSGHFANWEVFTGISANLNIPMALTYREPNNPHVAKFLLKIRNNDFLEYIPKSKTSAKYMMKAIKDKKKLGILVDQKLNEGIDIPFFNKNAKTNASAASLALKFKCPIVMIRITRLKNCNFKVVFKENIEIIDTGDKVEDTRNIMLDINQELEKWVIENPEQWLWLHRRWGK